MIQITDKVNCCGCSACAQRCPQQCISMVEDEEGFMYPRVGESFCVDCGLCEKVCPVLNQGEIRKPLEVYAALNPNNEIRLESSSGGIFTIISSMIIKQGGVVFGAVFDQNWEVYHTYTETEEKISAFRGSKYVQSRIEETFKQIENFLKRGRLVLFSGTSCQVLGLKRFLYKGYDNLLTIEIVCHGVSSPKIWREYFKSLNLSQVGNVQFKDKRSGWRGYSFTIVSKDGAILFSEKASENKYMMAFFRNLTLRPSCFACPAKEGKSGADITLADYWGIEHFFPNMDDNKGVSFVCCNTIKGYQYLSNLNIQMQKANYDASLKYNPCIYKSTLEPTNRIVFWQNYHKQGILALLKLKKEGPSIFKRIINRIIK